MRTHLGLELAAAAWLAFAAPFMSAQEPAPTPAPAPSASERLETWPSGTVKLRVPLDEQGREHGLMETFAENGTKTSAVNWVHGQKHGSAKEWDEQGKKLRFLAFKDGALHGRCEEFHATGRTSSAGSYRDGLRTGTWTFEDETGLRRKTADYKDDLQHGPARIHLGDKLASKQTWKLGVLEERDGLRPFAIPKLQRIRDLRAIHDAAPGSLDATDPLASERAAALRRLQTYRALCGLPFAGMSLVPDWNQKCDAAAELCRRIGKLDHTPPKPDGVDDARYQLGYEGASHSNLAINATLPQSVDGYMDDSDPSNIDRIGHRRWCLNPAMKKTGFGSDGTFHAMWSFDESGQDPKGLDAVYYPPPGYVPVDLFSPRRAFSIMIVRGTTPKKDDLVVSLRALDDDFMPIGGEFGLDHCDVAPSGFGGQPCIVFRPTGFAVEPGVRYLIEVSYDKGKTHQHVYIVEFVDGIAEAGAGR